MYLDLAADIVPTLGHPVRLILVEVQYKPAGMPYSSQ